jgi:uncharacterized membrane protein YfcA
MTHVILLALIGFAGGAFGGMVGLGGGVFIIPGLTLFLGVPIHSAVSASLIAVVATSTTAAAAYVREDVTNMRLGMTLETMTVVGALAGGIVGATMGKAVLSGIFGGVMVLVSVYMAVRRRDDTATEAEVLEPGLLGATYYDRSLKREVTYRPRRLWSGMLASLVAGGVSGLLGVGGGFLKVPVMVMSMRVPPRAAVSTSSFMIGVTACVGSIVYLMEGLVDPVVVVPVVLGVTVGAYLGSKLALRIRSSALVTVLAAVLFILSIQMILAAAGISLR